MGGESRESRSFGRVERDPRGENGGSKRGKSIKIKRARSRVPRGFVPGKRRAHGGKSGGGQRKKKNKPGGERGTHHPQNPGRIGILSTQFSINVGRQPVGGGGTWWG